MKVKVEYYGRDANSSPDEAFFTKDEFPAVPRVGDTVDFSRFAMAKVDQVVWTPEVDDQDVVILVSLAD